VLILGFTHLESQAEPIPVRYAEGLVHGFLILRTLDGVVVADGDLLQVARGDRVTAQLVFRFRDGSVHDETAVYTQRRQFRLVSYHLRQQGPAFPRALEMTIDAPAGTVTVTHSDDDGEQSGEQKIVSEHMDLPDDLANGMVSTLLKNVKPGALPRSLSYLAATPKPRVVKLEIATAASQDRFVTGRRGRLATHYVVKVEIGGLAGVIAPLVGKQPPDSHVWILGGTAPAFVRAEQTLAVGGPTYRVELTSPSWPRPAPAAAAK